jgi:hypothetical protein
MTRKRDSRFHNNPSMQLIMKEYVIIHIHSLCLRITVTTTGIRRIITTIRFTSTITRLRSSSTKGCTVP